MRKIFLVLATISLILNFSGIIVRAQEGILWEDFEGELKWIPVDWENVGQVELSLNQEKVSEGGSALEVVMKEEAIGWKNKVVFSKEDYLNLSGANIVLDVYSPHSSGICVTVAFDTGGGWAYFEAPSQPMKKGWNKDVTFDLSAQNFKCRESDWKHIEPLANRDDVRKVHIMVYRPSKMETQTVYIDNIRFK